MTASGTYWAHGLLAGDNYDLANLNLITKRNLAVPILHSLGRLYDDGYVRAISPALSASLLLALWWYHSTGTQPTQSTRPQGTPSQTYCYAVGVAMLLLLVSNNRYVFHSFYVNGHLFFAICYVVITASGWLLATRPNVPGPALLGLIAAAIVALTVTRPEAPLAIMLAIAPLLASDTVTLRSRALVLGVYGASTIVWSSFVITAFVKAGGAGSRICNWSTWSRDSSSGRRPCSSLVKAYRATAANCCLPRKLCCGWCWPVLRSSIRRS